MGASSLQPADLAISSFTAYPPQARALAVAHLALLRRLPLPLLPILLREVSGFDWKFPREAERLTAQLEWLGGLSPASLSARMEPFRALALPAVSAALQPEAGTATPVADWINDAPGYMEQLTAALWSTGQMPAFRAAAEGYASALAQARPEPAPAQHRLVVVVLDTSLAGAGNVSRAATFSQDAPSRTSESAPMLKLRSRGVLLDRVDPENGLAMLEEHLSRRSKAMPETFAHWQIAGDAGKPWMTEGQTAASTSRASQDATPPPKVPPVIDIRYGALEPVRQQLLARARRAMAGERSGPEELRTLLARLTPSQIGFDPQRDATLARFELSLLTEGSGTQIFATTFVQWAARECLRRAQPLTLLARFTPRQREQGMNEMLSGAPSSGVDITGSRADAEQGAWYTWLNLQRLSQSESARFLFWQEGSSRALALGPGLPRGSISSSRMDMQKVLELLA